MFLATEGLAAAYPDRPVRLRHALANDDRFSLASVAALAARTPPTHIEYNAGDLPIDQDPTRTPSNGLTAEETIRRIEHCRSWMVLKNVERDPVYAEVMNACLAEIAPLVAPKTGPMAVRQAYLFVTSPGSVTPFHMDPEHNILLQIRGAKTMVVYPVTLSRALPGEIHEAYHSGDGHRNLRYEPSFEAEAETHVLEPGDAVHVPVKAPHRVTNGDAVSVSFSITWRSRVSDAEAQLHLANRRIRALGGRPPPAGAAPLRDAAAIVAHKAARRLGVRD